MQLETVRASTRSRCQRAVGARTRRARTSSSPARSASTSRSSTTIRRAACFYAPVDLNDRAIARAGRPRRRRRATRSSTSRWSTRWRCARSATSSGRSAASRSGRRARTMRRGRRAVGEEYVPRLRIYPHALREANAYYSPAKKALLFGYFPAAAGNDGRARRRSTVFTCLSHDIVAHEVTHALLDGMHRRFNEPSNPDVLAFHEAFADIVALFQHFSLPDVLRHQIAATRGDLASQNRLGELAQQFGQAIGKRGALRSAIGEVDERPASGSRASRIPTRLRAADRAARPRRDSRRRGVRRVPDHLQGARRRPAAHRHARAPASCPPGSLHPDLVDRLADEAAGVGAARARHVHPRARLLPAGRHHLRRLPARDRDRRLRARPGRRASTTASRSSRRSAATASSPRTSGRCRSTACSGGRPPTRRTRTRTSCSAS